MLSISLSAQVGGLGAIWGPSLGSRDHLGSKLRVLEAMLGVVGGHFGATWLQEAPRAQQELQKPVRWTPQVGPLWSYVLVSSWGGCRGVLHLSRRTGMQPPVCIEGGLGSWPRPSALVARGMPSRSWGHAAPAGPEARRCVAWELADRSCHF